MTNTRWFPDFLKRRAPRRSIPPLLCWYGINFRESNEVINRVLSENPFCFTERELALVASWRRRIFGDFLIYKHLKKYTVFIGQGGLYGVVGLASPIADIFPSFALPRYAKTALLPFEGKITYDSLLFTYNITFGSGAKRGFNEEYRELKNKTGVIMTL
ncbi:MAG TPA: hypothetical protein DCK76_04460 [Desulfotomaculum sp.]|nr:hypothetical protein [Desulfotomaculum sp.]HBY03398.1 hypothetical protein [Desulfotomaculum sp.]